jgi:pyruvate dehydrogenase kinase 2/3/4
MATFVRQELPIRLAHRILDLDRVPLMRDMPSVQAVKQVYIQSFLELIQLPPLITDSIMEANFSSKLEVLYQKHSNVLIQMARGAYELRQAIRDRTLLLSTTSTLTPYQRAQQDRDVQELIWNRQSDCHVFLDKFYMSRIGIRVLAGQYLALRNPTPPPGYIGMICQQLSPKECVERAAEDATVMCNRKYGEAPHVAIDGQLDLTFPYIPTHLHYILLELLRNAMRATVEQHQLFDESSSIPPVTVIIADGTDNEDVVIKIMDEGGGIPRSQVENIWSYLFTTADASIQDAFVKNHHDHSQQSPIAGLGYGLPISRSYARYFGGDLDIMSMEGYGTDAYVYLVRLGDSPEPLPT